MDRGGTDQQRLRLFIGDGWKCGFCVTHLLHYRPTTGFLVFPMFVMIGCVGFGEFICLLGWRCCNLPTVAGSLGKETLSPR
jgi:hypothetical protein